MASIRRDVISLGDDIEMIYTDDSGNVSLLEKLAVLLNNKKLEFRCTVLRTLATFALLILQMNQSAACNTEYVVLLI